MMSETRKITENPAAEVQNETVKMTRDDLGFVTSEQPNLSLEKVKFLLALVTYDDPYKAGEATGISREQFVDWLEDREFADVYVSFRTNKREGTKQIGQQLTPMLLLHLTEIMESGTNKEKLGAAKLIAQMQGLLITHQTRIDTSALEQLRERLMAPRPVYKELSNGSS